MTIAMVFPGQGSQSPGMQAELAAEYPVVLETYAVAADVLGYDLWDLVQSGPASRLGETVVTQPAMLTAGVAAYRAWQTAGGQVPGQMAGHSLGEYTALVCADAISLSDALVVVRRRAELMQYAVPQGSGAMAAVLGLDDDAVRKICEAASTTGVAEPVNFNSPGQVVLAGHANAIDRAIEEARAAGARRAIKLPVSVPAHSSLMQPAGEALYETLADAAFGTPAVTVIAATDGQPYADADDLRERLSRQVYAPVQWVETVQAMIGAGATSFVECGPGKVLAGLVRRIDKSTPVAFIDNPDSLRKALEL